MALIPNLGTGTLASYDELVVWSFEFLTLYKPASAIRIRVHNSAHRGKEAN